MDAAFVIKYKLVNTNLFGACCAAGRQHAGRDGAAGEEVDAGLQGAPGEPSQG